MLFRNSNIKIEFTEEEKEALKKAQSILDDIAKKMGEDPWRSLGIDDDEYFNQDEVNWAVGVLEVLNNDKVEILIG